MIDELASVSGSASSQADDLRVMAHEGADQLRLQFRDNWRSNLSTLELALIE